MIVGSRRALKPRHRPIPESGPLKWWNVLLSSLAALLLAAILLAWFAPVRWLAPWLDARLHGIELRGLSGSVWDGRADALVLADGTELGRLHWTVSRRALLGRLQGHIALTGPMLDAAGDFLRAGDTLRWHDVRLRFALDRLVPPPVTPFGRPRGELRGTLAEIVLRGGWPLSMDGQLRWTGAAIDDPEGTVALGDLAAIVTAREGVIQARLQDDGRGPLRLDGHLQASPLGWRLQAALAPRGDQPALARWLTRLGPPDALGVVHLQRGAGLGAVPASTGVSR
ncbi:MAG: type II secretion system protein N [Xanthomonadaceae bacterium]|nr:type II secretion system protein N [Xanthomonadaceae bacterium]MDE1962373.1 type II secretion system protein N [Xanthomonadaceae bacterium]